MLKECNDDEELNCGDENGLAVVDSMILYPHGDLTTV